LISGAAAVRPVFVVVRPTPGRRQLKNAEEPHRHPEETVGLKELVRVAQA
jgi:hypothetical protein